MDDGDVVDCMLNMSGSIGIFGDHAGSPGLAFLQPGAKLDDAPAAAVREIAARCRLGGSEGDAPYFVSFPAAGLLPTAQRAALFNPQLGPVLTTEIRVFKGFFRKTVAEKK